jgi:hypothetical protein
MAASRRLGPLGLSDLLDEVIRLYRAGFKRYLPAMAIPALVLGIAQVVWAYVLFSALAGAFGGGSPNVGLLLSRYALAIPIFLPALVVFLIGSGAVTRMTADLWLGQPPDVRRGYAASLGRFWPMLGTAVLIFLITLGLVLASYVLLIPDVIVGWLILIGGLIVWFANPRARRPWLKWLIILSAPMGLVIYFFGLMMVVMQAVVLEGLGPRAAMGRSRALVRGEWWRVFGVYFLSAIIIGVLQAIPGGLMSVLATLLILALSAGSSA